MLLSRPTNVLVELSVIKMYRSILLYVQSQLEEDTTLEQDLDLLKVEGNFYRKMAIVYRSERKKIVRNQLSLITWLIEILRTVSKETLSKTQFN